MPSAEDIRLFSCAWFVRDIHSFRNNDVGCESLEKESKVMKTQSTGIGIYITEETNPL